MDNKDWGPGEPGIIGRPYRTLGEMQQDRAKLAESQKAYYPFVEAYPFVGISVGQEAARAQMQEKTCGGTAQEARVPRLTVTRHPVVPCLGGIKEVTLVISREQAYALSTVLNYTSYMAVELEPIVKLLRNMTN